MAVRAVPEGYRTVTPYLVTPNAAGVIEFAQKAFGAEEVVRMASPDGRVMHAEIRIGDSMVMLGDVPENDKPKLGYLHIYIEDCDGVYARALAAGATSVQEPANQFYGD